MECTCIIYISIIPKDRGGAGAGSGAQHHLWYFSVHYTCYFCNINIITQRHLKTQLWIPHNTTADNFIIYIINTVRQSQSACISTPLANLIQLASQRRSPISFSLHLNAARQSHSACISTPLANISFSLHLNAARQSHSACISTPLANLIQLASQRRSPISFSLHLNTARQYLIQLASQRRSPISFSLHLNAARQSHSACISTPLANLIQLASQRRSPISFSLHLNTARQSHSACISTPLANLIQLASQRRSPISFSLHLNTTRQSHSACISTPLANLIQLASQHRSPISFSLLRWLQARPQWECLCSHALCNVWMHCLYLLYNILQLSIIWTSDQIGSLKSTLSPRTDLGTVLCHTSLDYLTNDLICSLFFLSLIKLNGFCYLL